MISDLKIRVAVAGLCLPALVAVALWPQPAEATRSRSVDCVAGNSIQKRMDAAIAAARFLITNLLITGSSYGVEVTDGASGTIDDVRISENERSGIRAALGASLTVTDSRIDKNGRDFPAGDAGIEVLDGATLLSTANLIEKNAFSAVSVTSHAVFRNGLRDDPDDERDNRDRDTYLQLGCLDGESSGCGTQDGAAISVDIGGLVELRNARTTGTVKVAGVSTLEVSGSRIFGNVNAEGNSGSSIGTTATGEGRLLCASNAFSYGTAVYRCGNSFLSGN